MQSSWIRWMSRLSLALKNWTGFTVLNWYTPLVEVNQAISSLVVIDTSLHAISTTWTLSNSKKLGNLEKRKLSVDWEWIRRLTKFCNGNWMVSPHLTLGSFAQWRYSNQWSNREVLLLLVGNYTQYPAISTWNIVVLGNFWKLLLEQLKFEFRSPTDTKLSNVESY